MSDDTSLPEEFDPTLYGIIGNITSDWGLLEYKINKCIWQAANIEHDQLGACITAQIPSFQGRMEALLLLARERGASKKCIKKINTFIEDSRALLEARNRAAHDPLGVERGKHVQLQITARGRSVFVIREITLEKLISDRDKIDKFMDRFDKLASDLLGELGTLPYRPTIIFPQVSRHHG